MTSTSAETTGAGSGSIHGARQQRTSSTPGSSSAAWRPRGPHSSVTRSHRAASARMAGPASRTSPSLSRRTAEDVGHGAAQEQVDGFGQRARHARARPRSRPRGVRGVGTMHRAGAGGRAASTSAPMSPTIAQSRGCTPRRAAARRISPGCGLAARAAVVRAVRAVLERAERAEQRLHPRVDGRDVVVATSPRAMPDWLETIAVRHAGRAQALERLARARHRLHALRVAVVRDVGDQRAVAVEEDRRGQAARRARRGAGARRRAATRRWPRTGSPRSSTRIVATSAASAGRGRSAPTRTRRCRASQPAPRSAAQRTRMRGTSPARRARRPRPRPAARDRGREVGAAARRAATPARAPRQSRPCRRRISTSSALPACLVTEIEAGRRPNRVHDVARARDDPPAALDDAQAEVGILAVGAREALVEAADGRRARRGGTPCPRSPTARCSRPATLRSQSVGARPHGNDDPRPGVPATSAASAARSACERRAPARRREHVVVEERDPLRRGRSPARVARRGGARGRARDHARRRSRAGADRSRRSSTTITARSGPERLEQPLQRRAARRRDDDRRSSRRHPPRIARPRRRRNGPIASASTGAEPKHSSASRGSSTIGRPAVLSEVLTTTGTPVRASKRLEHARDQRLLVAIDGLDRARCRRRGRPPECDRATPGATPWVKSMYGRRHRPVAKISARPLGSTIGATGRNCSRPLMSLSCSRFSARRGSASRERWPSARGPNSERPWNQATTPSSARISATASAMSSALVELHAGGRQRAPRAPRRPTRDRAPRCASAARRPRAACATCSAAPSAVPESPEAGCTHTRANGPSRHSREFATQLSATPPASTRSSSPVRSMQPVRQVEQHLFQAALDRARQRRVRRRELARPARAAARSAPSRSARPRNPPLAVGVDELAQLVEEGRLPVGGHRHHLVLVRGPAEAEVRGQLLVEEPERVRQRLRGEDLERPSGEAAGEVRGALPAAVEHEHRARVQARSRTSRRRRGRRGAGTQRKSPVPAAATSAGTAARAATYSVRRPSHSRGGDVAVRRRPPAAGS